MRARGRLAAAGICLVTAIARGEEDLPFRLAYDAPAECPPSDDLVQRIRSYSRRVRLGGGQETATALSVTVTAHTGGFTGVLDARRPGEASFVRSVPAPDCEQSIAAIALIAAIAIDPEASLEAAGPARAEAPPSPEPQPAPEVPPPPPMAAPGDTRPERSPPGRAKRPLGWSLGARAGATSAIAPQWIPDVGAVLAYEANPAGWFALRASLSALYGFSGTVPEPSGSARYDRAGARLSACPLELPEISVVSLRPCADAEIGRLHAQGIAVPNSTERSLLWAAVGASVRADRMVAPWLTVGIQAGALFPLIRDGFYFDPGRDIVHRVEQVAAQFALELGLQPF